MTDDRDPTLTAARHLRRIVELAGMLEDQAVARSNHHDMPGGPAMVMLAPVASPQAWEFRIEAIEQRWWDDDTTGPEQRPYPLADEDGFEPPLQTLLLWSEALRYEHGAVLDVAPTIESEASWLTASLTWMWDHEPHFDEFERDLGRAVARMEAVLYAGERDERSWVPCLECTTGRDGTPIKVRLVRSYDEPKPCTCPPAPVDHAPHGSCLHVTGAHIERKVNPVDGGEDIEFVLHETVDHDHGHVHPLADACCLACHAVAIHARHTQGGREPTWKCPRCRRKYDEDGYNQAQAETLRLANTEPDVGQRTAV